MATHQGGALRARRRRFERRQKPAKLSGLSRASWGRIARRTFDQFRAHGVTNLAAALTYRAVLALFPALIAVVALLGVLGEYPKTFNAVLNIVGSVLPASVVNELRGPLEGVITHKGGSGALLGIGLVGSIWAASGYIGAFSWACNIIWEAKRGRSWYRQWPFDIAVTLVALVLLTLMMVGAVVSGPIARSIGSQLGIGSAALSVWAVAKWPAMVAIATILIAGLYYLAPNVRQPSVRFITPGAILAVVAATATSFGFGAYVAHFSSYNATYGVLGGIVTFLVWVWWTNVAILLGAELDSEIERERQLLAGDTCAEERIQMPLRQA